MAKKNLADALVTNKTTATTKKRVIEPETTNNNSRHNKTHVGAYFDQVVHQQLNLLAAEQGIERNGKVTLQNLMGEALNDLFKKYGKPPIASN